MPAPDGTAAAQPSASPEQARHERIDRVLILAGILLILLVIYGIVRPNGTQDNGWIEDVGSWLLGLWCGASLAHKHIVKPMREHHEEVIALHKAHHAELLERIDRKAK
jgi:hypothetical protein